MVLCAVHHVLQPIMQCNAASDSARNALYCSVMQQGLQCDAACEAARNARGA